MPGNPTYGRRDFLKDSVLSVAKAAHEFAKQTEQTEGMPTKPAAPVRKDWLRPPGAVGEALFMDRCTSCGDCAKACPYESIGADPENGTPIIFPDESPCHLCDDFPCIESCGTEALMPVTSRGEVRMGIATVSHRVCTAGQGCHACVSKCPMVALAMDFDQLRLTVSTEQCVGCGICEQVCRTVNDHIAVRITPTRLLTGTHR